MSEMKRYDVHLHDPYSGYEMQELQDGAYVLYEDAAKRIAELEVQVEAWKKTAHHLRADLNAMIDEKHDAIKLARDVKANRESFVYQIWDLIQDEESLAQLIREKLAVLEGRE